MRKWDIGLRVLLAAVVPTTLIAIVLGLYFTYARIGDLEREQYAHGMVLARQLAPASEYGVFSENREFLQQLTDALVRESAVSGAAVMSANGRVLARSGTVSDAALAGLRPPQHPEMHLTDGQSLIFSAAIGRAPARVEDPFAEAPQHAPEEVGPIGIAVVETSTAPLEARKRDLALGALLIALVGLVAAGVLARWLAVGVTLPVMRLAQTVGRIKSGDLSARASTGSVGVLGVLEGGINDMAASLETVQADLEQRIARATDELQQQKERAEEANRTKTQFLAAASHDLRQPIQAAGLFLSTLQLRAQDAELRALAERAERALAGQEAILEGLLDISRLDAGVVTPRIEAFPVQRLFDRIRDAYAAQAAGAGLELRVAPSALWCRSDALLLERVVSNLVSNALRYTARGGVLLGCRRAQGQLRIEVWDTGLGIAPERREEIFQEFVQLTRPPRRGDKGLGLGLAIVQRLTRLLGHALTLESTPERGSVFALAVPRARPRRVAALPAQAASVHEPLTGKIVVAIDDDQDVVESLETYLTQLGAVVIPARDADAAAAAVASLVRVDLIVSDYGLGRGPNGVQAIATLRARLGEDVPAIIITGETSESLLRSIAGSGLPILHKPVRPGALEDLLARVLARAGPST
jgi:signal transduction histidine kinase